jgi:shikimate kinase
VKPFREIHNLAIVGFMGTGKSSVGRILADQLRFRFIDTDEMIEEAANKSINRIFQEDGESAFRELERRVVVHLEKQRGTIVSTGGGLITNVSNLVSLKTHALVVCLWASPEAIWERVRGQSHRPLLQVPDPETKIRELLGKREPFYRQADVLVNTNFRSAREVAQHVLHHFHSAQRSHERNHPLKSSGTGI